jgi:hypothetical protein
VGDATTILIVEVQIRRRLDANGAMNAIGRPSYHYLASNPNNSRSSGLVNAFCIHSLRTASTRCPRLHLRRHRPPKSTAAHQRGPGIYLFGRFHQNSDRALVMHTIILRAVNSPPTQTGPDPAAASAPSPTRTNRGAAALRARVFDDRIDTLLIVIRPRTHDSEFCKSPQLVAKFSFDRNGCCD